jgi:hypothetical protein
MLSELHNLSSKLCSKQQNKIFVLHLKLVPQLGGSWQHNYSTKTRQAGQANEHSMYSLMSMHKRKKEIVILCNTLQPLTFNTRVNGKAHFWLVTEYRGHR